MTTIGTYQGVAINSGTDAQVAAQMAAIDASIAAKKTTSSSVANQQNLNASGLMTGTGTSYSAGGTSSAGKGNVAQVSGSTASSGAPIVPLSTGSSSSYSGGGSSSFSGGGTPTPTPTTGGAISAEDLKKMVSDILAGIPTQKTDTTAYDALLKQLGAQSTAYQTSLAKINEDSNTAQASLLKQMNDMIGAPESSSNALAQAQSDTGILAKQQKVTELTSQLNAITAGAQAMQIGAEGQGRGIPSVLIGGQQAQVAKEAAIRALPISAQLAAAQGDLEMANSNMQMLFQVKVADLTAQYNYKKDVVKSVYDLASSQEQKKLDAAVTRETEAYNKELENQGQMQSLVMNAMKYKQQDIVDLALKLDTKSPAFGLQVATLAGQLENPSDALDLQIKQMQVPAGELALKSGALDMKVKQAQLDALNNPAPKDARTQIVDETGTDGITRKFLVNLDNGEVIKRYDTELGGGAYVPPEQNPALQGLNPDQRKAVLNQNALDTQTTISNWDVVNGVLSKYKNAAGETLTPDNITVDDLDQLNDADGVALGSAVAQVIAPTQKPGDKPADLMHESNYNLQWVGQKIWNIFGGRDFTSSKALEAIDLAKAAVAEKMRVQTIQNTAPKLFNIGGVQYKEGDIVSNPQGQRGQVDSSGKVIPIK